MSGATERPLVGVPTKWDGPSHDAVADFVSAFEAAGYASIKIRARVGRVLSVVPFGWRAVRAARRRRRIVTPLMGARLSELAYAATLGEPVVFAWDVWEPEAALWSAALRRYGVRDVYVTNSFASAWLTRANRQLRVTHVPEAIRVSRFDGGAALESRGIKVLEMGRQYDQWHNAVVSVLAGAGVSHSYRPQGVPGAWEPQTALDRKLQDSAISVCFPRSVTHPGTTGSVETLTQRYLESMAAGCLVLGKCPGELEQFFGYNPVVEVDWNDPGAQLMALLENLDAYQPLVNRNREMVAQTSDWSARVIAIMTAVGRG